MDAHPPATSAARRSWLAPVWAVAKIQGYWSILQIRSGSLIAWLTALVEMFVARQLWIALFNGRATYDGYTLDQTLAYVVLSMAITSMLKDDGFLYWKIRSGNIIFELIYPLPLPANLLAFGLSSVFTTLFTIAAPLLLMAIFFLRIPLPASPAAWLAFAVSFLFGCLICLCIDILASLLGFWTTEIHGLMVLKNLTVAILSGAYLPLWIFPDMVERAVAWLPFRGIQYVPLSILVGWIGPEGWVREIAVQLGWVVILWFAVEGLYRLAVRRFETQGG